MIFFAILPKTKPAEKNTYSVKAKIDFREQFSSLWNTSEMWFCNHNHVITSCLLDSLWLYWLLKNPGLKNVSRMDEGLLERLKHHDAQRGFWMNTVVAWWWFEMFVFTDHTGELIWPPAVWTNRTAHLQAQRWMLIHSLSLGNHWWWWNASGYVN